MLRPDAELVASPEELLFRCRRRRCVVHSDVMHVHAPLVLAVESPHVGPGSMGPQHDRDPMQLLMPRMENVPRHRPPRSDRGREVPVERGREVRGDRLRRATLDLVAVHKVHDLAVAQ